MCNEKTKHLWYKYYGLFVRIYVTSQQNYLSQINTYKQVLRHILMASVNHVIVVRHNPWQWLIKNVIFYCIERHFKQLFTVNFTGELTNRSWYLYRKCFVVPLQIDDFTFIAHAQKSQSERFKRPDKCKRNTAPVVATAFLQVANRIQRLTTWHVILKMYLTTMIVVAWNNANKVYISLNTFTIRGWEVVHHNIGYKLNMFVFY